MSTPPDSAERNRALDVTRSFIVQAPAGSGKTELLAQRYLELLSRVDRPEEILALTFTRKAAGEMRARVLAALDSTRGPEPAAGSHLATTRSMARAVLARDASLRWRIEAQPSRLRIMTIDALCALLARQLPWLSRAGGELKIAPRPEELYMDAARQVLGAIGGGPESAAPIERLLRQLDNRLDAAERLLAALLGRRDHWLRRLMGPADTARERLEAATADLLRQRFEGLRGCIPDAVAAELADLASAAAARLPQGSYSPLAACAGLSDLPGSDDAAAWRGLAELLLTAGDDWRRRVDIRLGFPPALRRDKQRFHDLAYSLAANVELRARLAECRRLPPARYSDEQWSVLAALLALLPLAAATLTLVFRERGEADFIAQSQAALDALGGEGAPTDLALALDYRIRHVLVDEFQDTSYTQYRLLAQLTAGWQEGDGRTLFLVGDPAQSIYSFREAEVGLFLAAMRDGIGAVRLESLQLETNFRSQRRLVDWVNEVFAPMMPAAGDPASGAVAYGRGEAWQAALPGDAVGVHPARDAESEADIIVELIRAARREDPAQGIAILVRGRAHLVEIAPRLAAAGLRFQAVEIERLAARPAIGDLLALTRALAHLADRTAWLAVLRAPWCGLALTDLHALVAGSAHRTVWDCLCGPAEMLSADGAVRLGRVHGILETQLAERGRHGLRDWVEQTWIALGGPATLEDPADLANAGAYFDALQTLRDPDADRLEAALDTLFASPDPDADDRLQVMTIHKAKGLEFDTVILPGLGRLPRSRERPLLHWLEVPRGRDQTDLLLAPIGASGGEADPLHGWIAAMLAQRDAFETQRVLYVAATRARRRLHLVGQVPARRRGGQPGTPRAGSFLHLLWPALQPQFETARNRPAAPVGTDHRPARGIRRLPAGWIPPASAADLPSAGILRPRLVDLEPPRTTGPASPRDASASWCTAHCSESRRRGSTSGTMPGSLARPRC